MSDFDGGMEMIDPVPLSDEDRADWGGGVTYVGPDGPENRGRDAPAFRAKPAARVIAFAALHRRRDGESRRPTSDRSAGAEREAA